MEAARPKVEREGVKQKAAAQGHAAPAPVAADAGALAPLVGLQRAAGNQAVSRLIAGGVPLQVQRAVGFEFEVGTWTMEQVNRPMTGPESQGTSAVPDTAFDPIAKGTAWHQGSNFALTADEGDDQEVPGQGATHIEWKTDAFEETDAGRKQLKTAMGQMKDEADNLIAQRGNAVVRRQNRVTRRLHIGSGELLTPWPTMTAEPQMTAGIRLEELAGALEKLASAQQPGETQAEHTLRGQGAGYLSGKKMADANMLAASPALVRARFQTFAGGRFQSPTTASESMISVLSLVRSYLEMGTTQAAYAKTIAPLLAKTDFATTFRQMPEAAYYSSYPDEWAALALHCANLADGALFSGGIQFLPAATVTKIQAALPRSLWLKGMARGTDYLTEENFPDQTVAAALFGFGARGGKMDTVGKKRKGKKSTLTRAPIIEFRRMAGRVPHTAWPMLALELFDYVRALNDRKNPTFTAEKTVKGRLKRND